MILEKLLYSFFGNNVIIGPGMRKQIEYLQKIVPEEFKGKETLDLGCGDGKITTLLKEIFLPRDLFGFDINLRLVKKAQKRGIKAEILDLEKEVPRGEMAILWGVLHHIQDSKRVILEVKKNFQLLFLREPLKGSMQFGGLQFPNFFELGKPFSKEEIKKILDATLNTYQSFENHGAIFVFWRAK